MNAEILAERVLAIGATLGRIRAIETASGINRPALAAMRAELVALAGHAALFPAADFRAGSHKAPEGGSRSYLLSQDPDGGFALYLNVLAPGQGTQPHDHGTWVVAAAVEGRELHRVYSRTDDGAMAGHAVLRLREETMVAPGQGIALMPDDIHSIQACDPVPSRHLHLYGMALDRLPPRQGYDIAAGTVQPIPAGARP